MAVRPLKTGCYQASVFDTFLAIFRRIAALRRPAIARITADPDPRLDELKAWLSGFDRVAGAEFTVASADASFRRYFRLTLADETLIAMDAPPPQEDCRPFVRVASYLEAMNLNAPRVVEANLERGFLLLTDLGNDLYLRQLLDDPDSVDSLYSEAMAALTVMQREGQVSKAQLPPYDAAFLDTELSLFHDWLCGTHLEIAFTADEEMQWREVCSLLIRNAVDQPQVFVHRDFHSRNLMITAEQNPGILDFQDAMRGPATYDLVSLLKDCYVAWPPPRVRAWAQAFHADSMYTDDVDADTFMRWFELMGVQRHLKAAGIFARLNHRDGKPGYLADIPRTVAYILELEERYAELEWLCALIRNRVLPAFDS